MDSETGSLLRLIAYDGDAPADGVNCTTSPRNLAIPRTGRIPPAHPAGTRIVEETGNPLIDYTSAIPGLAGPRPVSPAAAVHRCTNAVSAARSFLDDLRGHR